jgi:hypothetical protein
MSHTRMVQSEEPLTMCLWSGDTSQHRMASVWPVSVRSHAAELAFLCVWGGASGLRLRLRGVDEHMGMPCTPSPQQHQVTQPHAKEPYQILMVRSKEALTTSESDLMNLTKVTMLLCPTKCPKKAWSFSLRRSWILMVQSYPPVSQMYGS